MASYSYNNIIAARKGRERALPRQLHNIQLFVSRVRQRSVALATGIKITV